MLGQCNNNYPNAIPKQTIMQQATFDEVPPSSISRPAGGKLNYLSIVQLGNDPFKFVASLMIANRKGFAKMQSGQPAQQKFEHASSKG
jgi:hypothetical protein